MAQQACQLGHLASVPSWRVLPSPGPGFAESQWCQWQFCPIWLLSAWRALPPLPTSQPLCLTVQTLLKGLGRCSVSWVWLRCPHGQRGSALLAGSQEGGCASQRSRCSGPCHLSVPRLGGVCRHPTGKLLCCGKLHPARPVLEPCFQERDYDSGPVTRTGLLGLEATGLVGGLSSSLSVAVQPPSSLCGDVRENSQAASFGTFGGPECGAQFLTGPCFSRKAEGKAPSTTELPPEYLTSPLSQQSQVRPARCASSPALLPGPCSPGPVCPQLPPKRDETALQEEEELQLALALSQSEAEEKERMVSGRGGPSQGRWGWVGGLTA